MLRMEEPPYTPSVNKREKSAFLDSFPMEYPTGGIGDYRESCLNVRNEAGQMGCEIHYVSHEIYNGKKALKGLPASFGTGEEVQTLDILCEDEILGLQVVLSYSVFEKENVITRSVKLINKGDQKLKIEKIYSACLDMDNENFEMLTLHGSWAERTPYSAGTAPLWKTDGILHKGRIQSSGASVLSSDNTGNHSAAGQSLRNAFRIFRKLYRTGRVKPV